LPCHPLFPYTTLFRSIEHLAPGQHRGFFAHQRFTLNLTREPMKRAGYSPSIRLFEAAACGCAIITDYWPGLDTFFLPGKEILIRSEEHTSELQSPYDL